MITLAIDTATPQVSCALGGADGPIGEFTVTQGKRHGEVLAPAIEALCHQSGIAVPDVGRLAVDVGPGLFTGLRVGVSTAKALTAGLGCPIVGATSLEVLAYPHRRSPALVAAVVDARRGEVFWSLYRPTDGVLHEVEAPSVVAPEALADALASWDEPVLAVGDGACRYAAILTGRTANTEVGTAAEAHPSAAVLLDVVAGRATQAPAELMPVYLRQADVNIGWDSMAAAQRG